MSKYIEKCDRCGEEIPDANEYANYVTTKDSGISRVVAGDAFVLCNACMKGLNNVLREFLDTFAEKKK